MSTQTWMGTCGTILKLDSISHPWHMIHVMVTLRICVPAYWSEGFFYLNYVIKSFGIKKGNYGDFMTAMLKYGTNSMTCLSHTFCCSSHLCFFF